MRPYASLFQPIKIGEATIKNRIAMAPMVILGMTDRQGAPTRRALDYYLERARGGVGLIITSALKVENEIDQSPPAMPRISPAALSPLAELCEACHSWEASVFVQLTAGLGRVGSAAYLSGPPVSASATPFFWDRSITCRPLETEEVESIVRSFGQAARIAAAAGVDGLEIHGHEGYLLDQFSTAIWNRREDKYGGDLQGRLTFAREILREIKGLLGEDYPVIYRFGPKHYMKGLNTGATPGEVYAEAGRDLAEGIEKAQLLIQAGYDALHLDGGCYESTYWAHPPIYHSRGCLVEAAAAVKRAVAAPVISVGRLDDPEQAAGVIDQGLADIVALGRGLLAEPHWPLKAGQRRAAEIRPCIGCNEGCAGRLHKGRPLSCALNPSCGREATHALSLTPQPLSVVVVGGGATGLEAARVAALRGHKVTLYEKEGSLGGKLVPASKPDFKKDLVRLLNWFEVNLKQLGVKVRLGVEAGPEVILEASPDVVLLATGAKPAQPAPDWLGGVEAATSLEVLAEESPSTGEAVVIGGSLFGLEAALWLAKRGAQVTVLEAQPDVLGWGPPVARMNRAMLLDLLKAFGVTLLTGVKVGRVTADGAAFVDATGTEKSVGLERVIWDPKLVADESLHQELGGVLARVYRLGDCRRPQGLMNAIWDAYEVCRAL